MVSPTINEISGVDHPAHLTEGWLMMKDASPETALLLARAEAIAKGLDPTSVTLPGNTETHKGSVSTMPITDEVRATLAPEVQEYMKSLEDSAATATITKSIAAAADLSAAEFEKSLSSLPEPVQKSIMENQRRTIAAETMAKSLVDAAEDSKYEAMAKSLSHLPNVPATGFGSVLRKAAESNPTAFDEVLKVLKASDAAIETSGLFKEIGTGAPGAANAEDSILAIAKSLVAADTTGELSLADAVSKAALDNPDLYSAHRKEN
jgi:hypothetical protein